MIWWDLLGAIKWNLVSFTGSHFFQSPANIWFKREKWWFNAPSYVDLVGIEISLFISTIAGVCGWLGLTNQETWLGGTTLYKSCCRTIFVWRFYIVLWFPACMIWNQGMYHPAQLPKWRTWNKTTGGFKRGKTTVGMIVLSISLYGGVLKWGYPWIIHL